MEMQTKIDRISDLPWDILDTILLCLPVRDAVRTSILSRKWRYKWTGISQFVFDDKCISSSLSDKVARWGEIIKIMNQVQSNHSGPIEKFKLAAYCRPNYSDLDQWIYFLTTKGIKEFSLQDFDFCKRYKLPSCLLSSPHLSHLKLYGCVFELPPSFKGFYHLTCLELIQVSINGDTLENLIINCPVLERLTLLKIDPLTCLKIHNQNLKHLRINSEFEDIYLGNSPLLATVDICLISEKRRGSTPRFLTKRRACDLVRNFNNLSGIKRLTLSGLFLEFLAMHSEPKRPPIVLAHLVALHLKEVRFDCLKEVVVSLTILGSSPNLEELFISVGHSDYATQRVEFLKVDWLSEYYFKRLSVVRMIGFLETQAVHEFIKFVLARSPILERMTTVNYTYPNILKSLLQQVEPASALVKIETFTL
uniref:F-box domain-containing protein n=1 Tax=Davidia involucrata TaxID=16924 RepID=A0A5B7C9M4_DAVIN